MYTFLYGESTLKNFTVKVAYFGEILGFMTSGKFFTQSGSKNEACQRSDDL